MREEGGSRDDGSLCLLGMRVWRSDAAFFVRERGGLDFFVAARRSGLPEERRRDKLDGAN